MQHDVINPCREPLHYGYVMLYRLGSGAVQHCPACGGTHWYIGRIMAECAFCEAAIRLHNPQTNNPAKERPVAERKYNAANT